MEYLLGLSTDAGFVDEERFLVRFFCEFEKGMTVSCFSGEEGFDFFLAGELDGDPSGTMSWPSASWRRRGLFIPLSMSLIFEESSCESWSFGGGSEVSIGVGKEAERSSMGT